MRDLPFSILWASLSLLLGILIGKWIEFLVKKILKRIRFDQIINILGLTKIFPKFDLLDFFGNLAKWFFVILFLMLSFEILGLLHFSQFLEKVIEYFPNIFIACLIFILAVFLSFLSQKLVLIRLDEKKVIYSRFLRRFVFTFIWTVAILAILYQLKIVPYLILIIFAGFIFTISLSLGITFGLVGKDFLEKFLKDFQEKFK